jgi:hypothetical protein
MGGNSLGMVVMVLVVVVLGGGIYLLLGRHPKRSGRAPGDQGPDRDEGRPWR